MWDESLKNFQEVFKEPDKLISIPFIIFGFVAVGYVLHGAFFGFKPLDSSQLIISILISTFIFVSIYIVDCFVFCVMFTHKMLGGMKNEYWVYWEKNLILKIMFIYIIPMTLLVAVIMTQILIDDLPTPLDKRATIHGLLMVIFISIVMSVTVNDLLVDTAKEEMKNLNKRMPHASSP
ncbi:MAG: hypothetical protein V1921_04845 [Candidatus Altiarchaeota archaeon]